MMESSPSSVLSHIKSRFDSPPPIGQSNRPRRWVKLEWPEFTFHPNYKVSELQSAGLARINTWSFVYFLPTSPFNPFLSIPLLVFHLKTSLLFTFVLFPLFHLTPQDEP